MSKPITTYKTAVLKLHNPSNHRRAMLLDAMRRAERAYWKVLATIEGDAAQLVGVSKKDRKGPLRIMAQKIAAVVRPLPLGIGPKQAVALEAMAQVESYIELKASGQEAMWPQRPEAVEEGSFYSLGLSLIGASIHRDQENEARDLMAKWEPNTDPRPTGIYKNRVSDGMLILRDDKKRLFAYLNLHPTSSRYADPVNVTDMADMRTGEIVSFRSSTGALFPLELGEWHMREFLEMGRIQSGRIIYRDNEFYLAATFAYEAQPVETTCFLGVDRGIENIAGWSVVRECGVAVSGLIDGTELRRKQRLVESKTAERQRCGHIVTGSKREAWADEAVHIAANIIVSAAVKHRAQVVMEDLTAISNGPHHKRPKGQRRNNFSRLLNRAQYQKLAKVLVYKLSMHGLSEPMLVHAAFTSTTCRKCGHSAKENRSSQAIFHCVACHHEEHADLNASAVIGYKGAWLRSLPKRGKDAGPLPDHLRFDTWLKAAVIKGQVNVSVGLVS